MKKVLGSKGQDKLEEKLKKNQQFWTAWTGSKKEELTGNRIDSTNLLHVRNKMTQETVL